MLGFKFLRQHPIVYGGTASDPEFFIADFYCNEKRLVVEVDGKYHETQKDFDKDRDAILGELGISTLRIENEELENIRAVLSKIKEALTHPPSPSLFQREGVTELKTSSANSEGVVDKKFLESQKVIANPNPPSLQSREGVASRSEVGGEFVQVFESSARLSTHPPSPSLFQKEGVTELKTSSANSEGADNFFFEDQQSIENLTPPSLQSREGVPSLSEAGGEYNREANDLSILLLAAGSSSRLGQSKQLLKINNETLLSRTTKLSLQVSENVFVVLGANLEEHFQSIQEFPVTILENKEWESGMGSSLKVGFKEALKANPQTKSVIILVCDQPLLTATHLEKLIEVAQASGKPIVTSSYKSVLGVPALFKNELFAELLALGDSEGARKLILQKRNQVEAVDFPGGEIDLDTPEDVKNFFG